ncbi:hypothetical protein KZP23_12455 [Echinicola marina]|uniref:hypothetical protein n=1 Tax=Echinicola marina TaxID=2859768 RepID=UPI001CF64A4B|nr:hypothetical protein [Echinicola marina]UCS91569.1 hypothetical protein KZP23_12455 [Echinicola marina]
MVNPIKNSSFYLFVLLAVGTLISYNNAYAQASKDGIEVSFGPFLHSNSMNEDNYYNFKRSSTGPDNEILQGVNLKFTLPTRLPYLDIIFGSLIEGASSSYGSTNWSPQRTNSYDYKLNGGGVYAGVSPKLKGKHFGLTSEFAIGVFSYKEVFAIFNSIEEPYMDVNDRRTSFGLGGLSSIGFYVKFGRLGINPNLNAVFSGGDNASFTFYGLAVPLTYSF